MKYAFCLLAGACDAATGLLLMFAPVFTLQLMHITAIPTEPIYMRWIGAFVFSVGASYFLPFFRMDESRFSYLLEMTAWIRFVICIFVTTSVLLHSLTPMWLVVAATDGLLAAAQVTMLRRGVFGHAA